VDDDTNSREVNALPKAKGCDHPSMIRCAAITPGLESLLLLLRIRTLVQFIVQFAGVIRYIKSLRKFLDEVDPRAIDNTSVITIKNGRFENVSELLDDFFARSFDD
jgi:hypothetical protein